MSGEIKLSQMPQAPGVPYGYQDPDDVLREEAYKRARQNSLDSGLDENEAPLGSGFSSFDEWFDAQWKDPAFRDRWRDYAGWTEEGVAAARAAFEARKKALALDGGIGPKLDAARQRFLQNRAQQAALIGTLADRAQMGGTSAAQWASRAGMNHLMSQVAARAANDPRTSMRAMAAGGGALAQQVGRAQAQEGLARQSALIGQVSQVRGADLAQAAAEQQALADAIRWQNAKETAAQRWADIALRKRGVDLGVDDAIRRINAGSGGGIGWQDVASGILGGASAGLGTYASMRGPAPAGGAPAPPGGVMNYTPSTYTSGPSVNEAIDTAVTSALHRPLPKY